LNFCINNIQPSIKMPSDHHHTSKRSKKYRMKPSTSTSRQTIPRLSPKFSDVKNVYKQGSYQLKTMNSIESNQITCSECNLQTTDAIIICKCNKYVCLTCQDTMMNDYGNRFRNCCINCGHKFLRENHHQCIGWSSFWKRDSILILSTILTTIFISFLYDFKHAFNIGWTESNAFDPLKMLVPLGIFVPIIYFIEIWVWLRLVYFNSIDAYWFISFNLYHRMIKYWIRKYPNHRIIYHWRRNEKWSQKWFIGFFIPVCNTIILHIEGFTMINLILVPYGFLQPHPDFMAFSFTTFTIGSVINYGLNVIPYILYILFYIVIAIVYIVVAIGKYLCCVTKIRVKPVESSE